MTHRPTAPTKLQTDERSAGATVTILSSLPSSHVMTLSGKTHTTERPASHQKPNRRLGSKAGPPMSRNLLPPRTLHTGSTRLSLRSLRMSRFVNASGNGEVHLTNNEIPKLANH